MELHALRQVVYRLLTFRACTSAVEQNFSVLQKAFDRRAESLSEASENNLAKVILELPDDELPKIAQEAQRVWIHALGRARTTTRKSRVATMVHEAENQAAAEGGV